MPSEARWVETLWWLKYVHPGHTVFDIGANVGIYTQIFADKVGKNGHVFAVEPGPKLAASLRNTFKDVQQVHVVQHAVGRQNESGDVFHYQNWSLLPLDKNDLRYKNKGYIIDTQDRDMKEEFLCEYLTLDSMVDQFHRGRVDCIKIDVDGAEADVIFGGRAMLKRDQPLLRVELSVTLAEMYQETPQHLCAELKNLGYRFFADHEPDEYKSIDDLCAHIPVGVFSSLDCICLPPRLQR